MGLGEDRWANDKALKSEARVFFFSQFCLGESERCALQMCTTTAPLNPGTSEEIKGVNSEVIHKGVLLSNLKIHSSSARVPGVALWKFE